MTVKECYGIMGGDYEEVLSRLHSNERIEKYTIKFLDDNCLEQLTTALDANDVETAFRAAHTLKGICQNLGFVRLFESSNRMTEELRPLVMKDVSELLKPLKEDYELVMSTIKKLQQ